MARKPKFDEWKEQLRSIMLRKDGEETDYDEELARNYWREGYPPKGFFREVICADRPDEDITLEDMDLPRRMGDL